MSQSNKAAARAVAGAAVAIAVLIAVAVFHSRGGRPAEPTNDYGAQVADASAGTVPTASSLLAATTTPAASPTPSGAQSAPVKSREVAAVVLLRSPRDTIATQQRLLDEHDDAAFRRTFLRSVQSELTDAAIEACRRRLAGKTLHPDWAVAEESVEPGDGGVAERVVRVSIFGKSMTGFHEVSPGTWLADAAWCVPVW